MPTSLSTSCFCEAAHHGEVFSDLVVGVDVAFDHLHGVLWNNGFPQNSHPRITSGESVSLVSILVDSHRFAPFVFIARLVGRVFGKESVFSHSQGVASSYEAEHGVLVTQNIVSQYGVWHVDDEELGLDDSWSEGHADVNLKMHVDRVGSSKPGDFDWLVEFNTRCVGYVTWRNY